MTDVGPLVAFLWARRMGTLPQFIRTVAPPYDLAVAPVFWDALPKSLVAALTELLVFLDCVWRRRATDSSGASSLRTLSWHVVSFLSGTALAIGAAERAAAGGAAACPSPLLVGHARLVPVSSPSMVDPQTPLVPTTLPPTTEAHDAAAPPPGLEAPSSPSSVTRPKRSRSEIVDSPAGPGLATPRSAVSNRPRPPHFSLADEINAVFVEGDSRGASLPECFVMPPYDGVTCLFVRMKAPELLSDEQLNRFFGRYGQIRSQRLRAFQPCAVGEDGQLRFSEHSAGRLSTASVGGGGGSHAKVHTPHAPGQLLSGSVVAGSPLLQDFLVWVDSPANAVAAVVELRHSDVVVVAFHSPGRNCFSAADLLRHGPRIVNGHEWRVNELGADAAEGAVGGGTDDGEGEEAAAIVPELLVDHLPYWFTAEQVAALVQNYHDVVRVRLSIDDRSGAFMGCALLQLSSTEATALAAKALHGKELDEGALPLVCGVVTPNLEVHHLQTDEVLLEAPAEVAKDHVVVLENQRMWL